MPRTSTLVIAAIGVTFLVIAMVFRGGAAPDGPPAGIAWETTPVDRVDEKPRILYFTADWCGPCQAMKRSTWKDEQVQERMKAFEATYVDIDQQQDLAAQYGIRSIPTIVKLGPDGSRDARVGYLSPDEMIAFLGSD